MPHRRYAVQRVAATLTPFSHLQRAPYSGPVERVDLLTADGVQIGATLLRRRHRRLIVYCHGFGGGQRSAAIVWLAEHLVHAFDVLTFDWRGYGLSQGFASLGGAEALDLAAVLAAARDMGYRRVGLAAESMGGLIALATIGAESADPAFPLPDAMATLGAPAAYALTGGLRPQFVKYVAPVPWLRPLAPLLGFRLGEVQLPQPLDVIGQINLPLLFLHGDRDGTVPVRNAYLLHEHAPQAHLRIYPGVEHALEGMRAHSPRLLLEDLHTHFTAM